jgi:cytoskeleton protein RodZ
MRRKGEEQWPDEFYTELTVGEILRRARMQKGQDTNYIGQVLHIRPAHLEALERSDFSALPGHTFVIGFVRTYAEYLELDGGRVVGLLKHQSSSSLRPGKMNVFTPMADTRQPSSPIVIGVICALLLVAVIWTAYQNARLSSDKNIPAVPVGLRSLEEIEGLSKPGATTAVQTPTAPAEIGNKTDVAAAPTDSAVALAPSGVAPGQSAPLAEAVVAKNTVPGILIKLVTDSWVELRDSDAKVIEARLVRAGESIEVKNPVDETGRPYSLTAGDGGAVRLVVGDKELPPLSASGKVVRGLLLDPAGLLAKP